MPTRRVPERTNTQPFHWIFISCASFKCKTQNGFIRFSFEVIPIFFPSFNQIIRRTHITTSIYFASIIIRLFQRSEKYYRLHALAEWFGICAVSYSKTNINHLYSDLVMFVLMSFLFGMFCRSLIYLTLQTYMGIALEYLMLESS